MGKNKYSGTGCALPDGSLLSMKLLWVTPEMWGCQAAPGLSCLSSEVSQLLVCRQRSLLLALALLSYSFL